MSADSTPAAGPSARAPYNLKYSEANGTVSPKHVIYSEALAVTSVMRKNARWASSRGMYNTRDSALASNLGLRRSGNTRSNSEQRGSSEDDLMLGFEELKRELRNVQDIATLPLTTLLSPFFAIIRSPLSTGPITSAALSSLHNFFLCGIITPEYPNIDTALAELSSAVSHCKFEASDSSGDEVVLLKILTVIQDCMCGPAGGMLGDVEVCEMLETVLTTCVQMRLSETLRRSAELIMHALVRTVFSRLHALDPDAEEKKLDVAEENQGPGIGIPETSAEGSISGSTAVASDATEQTVEVTAAPEASSATTRPEYGLPSLVELLRVIINILDPNDRMHSDTTRLLALGILNAAFEVSGPRIGEFPSLRSLTLDHGCKYLFQLARSENSAVLHMALRTISTMMNTMRKHLKLQQELLLSFTIDRLAPPVPERLASRKPPARKGAGRHSNTASPALEPAPDIELEKGSPTPHKPQVSPAKGETRNILLEMLSQISRHPSFMVDLFINYDCDVNSENLFERVVNLLTEGVYAEYYPESIQDSPIQSQYLCLDLLLTFVNHMAARAQGAAVSWPSEYNTAEDLMQSKKTKNIVLAGAARFNTKPKTGLTFLEENGIIYHDLPPDVSRAKSLAMFLKSCTRLDKKLLGDFISKPDNIEVLTEFIRLFDFKGKTVSDALRELLESFRLPGESQQISRITETFAEIYFQSGPEEVKSQDAVYVLAYSIIMLNTDLHSPQIRKRMTIEDYKRNLRGVNAGEDFSPEYLQSLYDSIRKREIVMPEEHTGQLGFEFAWKELFARSRQSGQLMIANSSLFDKDMFTSVWKPVISAITYAFMTFDDEYIIERAIAGFRQCATLAGHFRLPEVFDFVVVSLSQATSLLSDTLPTEVPIYPVVEVEGQSITVSTLSVQFGANLKGQLAAVVLFHIVNGNGNAVREGWTQIFEMFQNLFIHSLLPTRMLQMEDFLGGVSMIPLRGSSQQPARPQPRSDGLLSALSSYLMTPYSPAPDAVPEATDSEIEATLCAIDCITTCRLDELYGQIMQLDLDPLTAAVRSLEALAHERTVARLQQDSEDMAVTFDTPSAQLDGSPSALPYDPASVFLLETIVSIVGQTPQHIEELWPIVFEHISALLSSSTRYSVLLIERAVVSLLRVCAILATKPSLRDQIYISFDLLGGLPPSVSNSVAEQTISGLMLILQTHPHIVSSPTEWNIVLALVRSTVSHIEAARSAFDLVGQLVDQSVSLDNAAGLIAVLDDFATAASYVAEAEMMQQSARRGGGGGKVDVSSSPVIERGRKAIDLMFELLKALNAGSADKTDPRFNQDTLMALASLSSQSTNASREIRHTALSQLTRAVLGPLVPEPPSPSTSTPPIVNIQQLFDDVLFPMIDDLIKVPMKGMEGTETRVRAAMVVCKAFMRFEVRDPAQQGGQGQGEGEGAEVELWTRVMEGMGELMGVDRTDQMSEAVEESLKNVVLVMNAAGMLVPPSPPSPDVDDARTEQQRKLWDVTKDRMDKFLPGLLEGVVPSPPPAPAPAPVPEVKVEEVKV